MSLLKFKALADETRMRLVHILFHYELSVNELVRILGMGQSRVSRHLKILAEAGLLKPRRDGLWVFYSVPACGANSDFLAAVLPYFPQNAIMQADMAMAAHLLEERALRTRQFFNSMAAKWDGLNREILGEFDLPAKVAAAVPYKCDVAVDLGCGTGAVLAAISKHAIHSIGVDGSASMLELCRARISHTDHDSGDISLRIGELSHLPLADHEANFACINLVLHHLPQPSEIFAEIRRILAPCGTIFLADFLRHGNEDMRKRYGDYWLGFDEEELESFLNSANFSICAREDQLVARKLRLIMLTARAQ